MDQRERYYDQLEEARLGQEAAQARIHTAFPGVVLSWDPDAMTCQVVPAVQYRMLVNQTFQWIDLPTLHDCPVHFPAGGGVSMTFPIKPGDECLVVIAERCIDAWWQNSAMSGGKYTPQPQMDIRMHNLSDGFIIPKVWSQPYKLAAISTDSAQMRTTDGLNYVELKEDGNVNVVTTQNVTITAAIDVTVNCLNATVNTEENATVNATLNATVNAGLDIDLEAQQDIIIRAQRDIGITAGRSLSVNSGDGGGGGWDVNVTGPITLKSDTSIAHTAPTISEN